MRWIKLISLFSTLVILTAWQPVYATSANSDTACYIYVSLRGDNAIAIYKMNPQNGSPEKIYTENVSGGPASLALDPSKRFLYVARRSDNAISAYRLNQETGMLTFINSIPAVDNPVYISTDESGRFLLSAYFGAGKAAIYPVGIDGSLQNTATETVPTDVNPHAIITDPSNRFLYITNMTGNSILQYQFDSVSGTLTALDPSVVIPPAGTGPRHIVFHGSKNTAFVVNETGNSVSTYQINDISGTIKAIQTISTLPAGYTGTNKSADIHITPDSRFLYASNRGHESIAAFKIDPDNDSLTVIGHYNTVNSPREFDIDPSGTYLYAAGETSDNMAWYRINNTSGALDSLGCLATGKTPSWVLVAGFVNAATVVNDMLPAAYPSGYSPKSIPNPFGSKTSICWFMDGSADIRITIYDVSGQLVSKLVDGKVPGGFCSVDWENEGRYPNSSIYYCRLESDAGCEVIKLVHVR
jgi:6-phosphogluconolactonase